MHVKEELGSDKILSETNGNKHEFTKKSAELWSAWIMDFPALINSHFLEKEKKGGSRTSAAALMGKISVNVRRLWYQLVKQVKTHKGQIEFAAFIIFDLLLWFWQVEPLGKFTQFECFAKVDACCAVVPGEALVERLRINNYQRFTSDFLSFSTCVPSSAPRNKRWHSV